MLKSLTVLAAVLVISVGVQAAPTIAQLTQPVLDAAARSTAVSTLGLKWKIGDAADYNISAGFFSGTVHAYVREDNGTEIWVQQDMSISGSNQKVEIQFDKASGQVLKVLADGKEQTLPDASQMEIVDQKEDSVTVPAGTFKAIYVKIKNKSDGKIQEAWINPQDVPMNGMIKVLADSPFGKVTQELTAKSFAP